MQCRIVPDAAHKIETADEVVHADEGGVHSSSAPPLNRPGLLPEPPVSPVPEETVDGTHAAEMLSDDEKQFETQAIAVHENSLSKPDRGSSHVEKLDESPVCLFIFRV